MKHKRICLYCGEPSDSLHYDCNCERESWTDLYRVLDIDMNSEPHGIAKSYHNYTFDNPEGLLQYKGLPYHYVLPNFEKTPGLTPLLDLSSLGIYHGCEIFLKNEGG